MTPCWPYPGCTEFPLGNGLRCLAFPEQINDSHGTDTNDGEIPSESLGLNTWGPLPARTATPKLQTGSRQQSLQSMLHTTSTEEGTFTDLRVCTMWGK